MGDNLYIYCIKYRNWDEIFLYNEIRYLSLYFKNIEIIPLHRSSENLKNVLPQNTSLNLGLSDFLIGKSNSYSRLKGIHYLLDWHFIKVCLRINPLKIKSLVYYYIRISHIKSWCLNNLNNNLNSIHYTYWFTEVTSALCLSRVIKSNCKIVSRAHRFDLYDEFGSEITNLFKEENIKYIHKLFSISEHGFNYLKLKFPAFIKKLALSRMGTSDPKFIAEPPEPDVLRIFTCSLIVKTKRISLIVEALKVLSDNNPLVKIEWIHAGTGLLEKEIEQMAERLISGKVGYKFCGFVPNSEIFRIYQKERISVLLNVSDSEGIPVSFMEAHSCGVPVIATSVGGTEEIVNDDNGILLSANPTPDEIAVALIDVFLNKGKWIRRHEKCRSNWEKNYNAEKNYKVFAESLLLLLKYDNKSLKVTF
jgi:glycosyltransferase involved in cell wall biosynthesis